MSKLDQCTCGHKWRTGQDGSHICSVRLKSALEEVRQQRDELLAALGDLLEDTQHVKHNCRDERCPVIHARIVFAKCKNQL